MLAEGYEVAPPPPGMSPGLARAIEVYRHPEKGLATVQHLSTGPKVRRCARADMSPESVEHHFGS